MTTETAHQCSDRAMVARMRARVVAGFAAGILLGGGALLTLPSHANTAPACMSVTDQGEVLRTLAVIAAQDDSPARASTSYPAFRADTEAAKAALLRVDAPHGRCHY